MTKLPQLSNLSFREIALIAVMLGLLIILGGWQFLIRPVFKNNALSQSQYDQAVQDYELVQRAAPQLIASAASAGGGTQSFNQAAIIDTARNHNITLSRVQPIAQQQIQIWFDDIASAQFYGFIQELKRNYAVEIAKAQINRKDQGISVQLTLMPKINSLK